MYTTDIEVNSGCKSAIWHSFSNITHIKINNILKPAILNLIELTFFRPYPSLKLHILFYSNGLAIWKGFPDTCIRHIKVDSIIHFELDRVQIFQAISLHETANFVL